MPELAAGVLNSATEWTLDTTEGITTEYVQVDDEIVRIAGMAPEHVYKPTGETIAAKVTVERGQSGTTAASHLSGAALTPVYEAASAGGGAITVTDGTTTVEGVQNVTLEGAAIQDDGGGDATLAWTYANGIE